MAPRNLLGVAQSDEVPSTSCTEGEELLRVRDLSARSRGAWKIAAVAAAAGLIAVAGTWWARDESLGKDGTGLATEYYRYATIGCSNWESIEISRQSGLTLAACQALCDADATCTMVNFQADPCEPGYYVAGGCILFKETCMTERNYCWELDYKVESGTITVEVVTQQFNTTWAAGTAKQTVELAGYNAYEAVTGVRPTSVTATAFTRRLGEVDQDDTEDWDFDDDENLRKLEGEILWVSNATWRLLDIDVAIAVGVKTKNLSDGDPALLATFNGQMPPEAETVTSADIKPPSITEEQVDPSKTSAPTSAPTPAPTAAPTPAPTAEPDSTTGQD